MEIVSHEKTATEQVVAKFIHLRIGQVPLTFVGRIDPGPVEDVVSVVEIHRLFD